MQSRVLSGSGDSSLGLVGVGIPAAAADAAAAATVGGVVERTGRAESFAERGDSPTNRTHTKSQNLTLTEMPNLTTTKSPVLTYTKNQDHTKMQDLTLVQQSVIEPCVFTRAALC